MERLIASGSQWPSPNRFGESAGVQRHSNRTSQASSRWLGSYLAVAGERTGVNNSEEFGEASG